MHPKLEALIARQRAREAAKADRALIELGLCTEKKVYFEGRISDADARELGFDQSEIVGGARMRYRVERTPLPLTAEERAIALKIYETRVREARERAKDAPPRRLRLEGRMCAEERYGRWNGIGQLFSWMGVALWVAGLVLGSASSSLSCRFCRCFCCSASSAWRPSPAARCTICTTTPPATSAGGGPKPPKNRTIDGHRDGRMLQFYFDLIV